MRVVLLDNRDSFVYNLVDQFATLGSQIEVYRNNVPASRVLTALEPTAAEREAGRRPVLCLSPGPGDRHRTGRRPAWRSASVGSRAASTREAGTLLR